MYGDFRVATMVARVAVSRAYNGCTTLRLPRLSRDTAEIYR